MKFMLATLVLVLFSCNNGDESVEGTTTPATDSFYRTTDTSIEDHIDTTDVDVDNTDVDFNRYDNIMLQPGS